MRVSDAERAEVADQLAQHYGDGRLDQAELDERLSRAMSAKTRADLTGITDDLPEVEARRAARTSAYPGRSQALTPAPRPRRQWPRVLPIVLLIVVVAATWHGLVPFWPWFGFGFGFGPWLWIALLACCWLRFGPRRHRR
ncbi:MAG: DUF1707 SHOCT-like domain-containing protein [Streptosporangiaceae bacterium]